MSQSNIETTIVDVEHTLTRTELQETAVRICQLDHEESEIELRKKAAATEWGAKLKANQTQRKTLCRQHRDGIVVLSHECRWENNYETGCVEYFSISNSEMVSSRAMTPEERQMKLFDQADVQDSPDVGIETEIPNYESMSYLQLQSVAKSNDIPGYKDMGLEELADVLSALPQTS